MRIKYDPGTHYSYSGEGMFLLQFVLEQIEKRGAVPETCKPIAHGLGAQFFAGVNQFVLEGQDAICDEQASTQFRQPMQRGFSDDCTTPSGVCLIASAGQTWAQVGSSQCMQI